MVDGATIKAFLIDQDDTLTRHGNRELYHRGAHKALTELLTITGRADEVPSFPDWQAFHHDMYESNDCYFTKAAEWYRFDRHEFFARMHLYMDTDDILYDVGSVPYLNGIADRAVIFTDAGRVWAEARAAALGHRLHILARDDAHADFERKQSGTVRWVRALEDLSARIGAPLTAPEVLVIDDSARVLLRAQELGFATAHCHWGFPDRAVTAGFDYTLQNVDELQALLAPQLA